MWYDNWCDSVDLRKIKYNLSSHGNHGNHGKTKTKKAKKCWRLICFHLVFWYSKRSSLRFRYASVGQSPCFITTTSRPLVKTPNKSSLEIHQVQELSQIRIVFRNWHVNEELTVRVIYIEFLCRQHHNITSCLSCNYGTTIIKIITNIIIFETTLIIIVTIIIAIMKVKRPARSCNCGPIIQPEMHRSRNSEKDKLRNNAKTIHLINDFDYQPILRLTLQEIWKQVKMIWYHCMIVVE